MIASRECFVILIGCGLLFAASGCESQKVTADVVKVVAVDRGTGEAFTIDMPATFPALNPETGKATLVQALYCSRCEQWSAAPPMDVMQRRAKPMTCPKHPGVQLTLDGPFPDTAGSTGQPK